MPRHLISGLFKYRELLQQKGGEVGLAPSGPGPPTGDLASRPGLTEAGSQPLGRRKNTRAGSFRGSKSRNKVSVGEPAEGSLSKFPRRNCEMTT